LGFFPGSYVLEENSDNVGYVINDFVAQNKGDLSISVHQLASILHKERGGWIYGSVGNQIGYFPENCIYLLSNLKRINQRTKVDYDYNPKTKYEIPLQKGDTITIIEEIGGGWVRGECNSKIGYFPKSFLSSEPVVSQRTGRKSTISNPTSESKPIKKALIKLQNQTKIAIDEKNHRIDHQETHRKQLISILREVGTILQNESKKIKPY